MAIGSTAQGRKLAPAVGLEPTTKRLTAARSTTELRRSASALVDEDQGSRRIIGRLERHSGHTGESGRGLTR